MCVYACHMHTAVHTHRADGRCDEVQHLPLRSQKRHLDGCGVSSCGDCCSMEVDTTCNHDVQWRTS